MRILVLTMELPFPPIGGARLRTHQFLEALAEKHEITIVGFTFDESSPRSGLPVRIVAVPWEWPELYRRMQSCDTSTAQEAYEILNRDRYEPWAVSYYDVPALSQILRSVSSQDFDLILIKDSIIARYLQDLPEAIPKVLDFQDVLTRMAQRRAEFSVGEERERALREAERMLNFERKVASQCVLSLACSAIEAEAVRRMLGVETVMVLPNEVDTTFFCPSDAPTISGYLLFTGTMNYEPNIEAVRHFATHIFPLILKEYGNARLHIVGKNPTKSVSDLASENIVVHGGVSDMRPYYRDAEVVVVPLLQGGGTRRKILEAAAAGKAIVTTSLGVEGLDFRAGADLYVADSPSDFAGAVVAFLEDDTKRRQFSSSAPGVAQRYDSKRIAAQLCEIVENFRCGHDMEA